MGVELKRRSSMWTDFWLARFAIVHARYLARCVLHRAAVCKGAASAPFTRASFVDVSMTPPPPPPPPPPQPLLPGNASAAAHAPAR